MKGLFDFFVSRLAFFWKDCCDLSALAKNAFLKNIGLEREWSLQAAEQLPNVNFVNLERIDFEFECAEDML